MKTKKTFTIIRAIVICSYIFVNGCVTTQAIQDKDGTTLWGENCQRCHNTPSPTDYSDAHWETIGVHMKVRANLTDEETKKIVEFLQSSN